MYIGVKNVRPLSDFKLAITFEDGAEKLFDAKPYLEKGIFRELKDEKLFNSVHVSFDTIEWDNGADLDPELLFTESR
ncbi:MAG: hypothetical protein A2W23_02395 [Planctomycetes bacterium RBG_16_43_13]|nr:MAG: hypothetical protein A2W23_02395 [Planctomycetes bacterium RBG_16_43_13]